MHDNLKCSKLYFYPLIGFNVLKSLKNLKSLVSLGKYTVGIGTS